METPKRGRPAKRPIENEERLISPKKRVKKQIRQIYARLKRTKILI